MLFPYTYLEDDNYSKELPDKKVTFEIAELISGSFIYPLHNLLQKADIDMDSVTEHLESLYDTSNHYGLIYFIIILADIVSFDLPKEFMHMSLKPELIQILSAAIIEDWLDIEQD